MALTKHTCKECGWQCKSCDDKTGLHLHVEIENLKQRLLEREHHIVSMETNFLNEAEKFPNGEFSALNEELLTWQEKYSRLYDSHKRVQKVNQSLEDKLLRLVDKFETEKNSLTRDLGNVTQRLAETRSKIKHLEDENERYRNDVNLAIQLLQCKPTNFVSQKLESLSPELQQQVRCYVSSKRPESNTSTPRPEHKILRVPIPTFPPTAMVYSLNKSVPGDKEENAGGSGRQPVDIVSAAIMAKVLEERARERLLIKHCETCTCSSQVQRSTDRSSQTDIQDVFSDDSNSTNQGLVRYVDVIAARSGNELNGTVKGDAIKSPKLYNSSSLRNIRYVSSNVANTSGNEGIARNVESMKLNDASSVITIENNNDGENSRSGHGVKRNGDICNNDIANVAKNAVKTSKKISDLITGSRLSNNNSSACPDDILWSNLSSYNNSPMSNQVGINIEVPSTELPAGLTMKSRDAYYGKADESRRLHSYLSKGETTRALNREGRSFLSDGINNKISETYSLSSPDKNILESKTLDYRLGMTQQRKTKHLNETPGPRACSLRMQAGTSNILLENATCYTPILYTSRPDILVHTSHSSSPSFSSIETGPNSPSES